MFNSNTKKWSFILNKELRRTNFYIDYSKDIENYYLILCLESPHSDEYIPKPPIPAYGQTGRKIQSLIVDVLNHNSNIGLLAESNVYNIALIEPVNYQASEGISPRKFPTIRDTNWLGYYSLGFSKIFEQKINYFKKNNLAKNTIILNACTNSTKCHLRDILRKQIMNKKFKNVYVFCGNHPSTWNKSKLPDFK